MKLSNTWISWCDHQVKIVTICIEFLICLYIITLSKLDNFTELFKVHTGPCCMQFLITGRLIACMAYIICLALASATLLGVGCWSSSSSHKYLLWTARLSLCHIIFRFTSFVVQNLGYFLFMISQTCAFQIAWLIVCTLYACFLGSFTLIILTRFFEGNSKVVWGTWWYFSRWTGMDFIPNIPRGVRSCFWFLITSVFQFPCGGTVVMFSCLCLLLKGAPNF